MDIFLLETESNRRGDVLTQLLEAYFLTLGYGSCTFNVHKSGREIDVQAVHLTENRLLRAESKATADPIGGADINKFAGALEVERRQQAPRHVAGYFVSLSGFTGTALEQEASADDPIEPVSPSVRRWMRQADRSTR